MSKKQGTLITIGIPVYNMSKSVIAAIESSLAQTYDNLEVLIVNDGSTDDSMNIIRENITDKRVRIYEREKNGGVCAAMRDLVEQARGEYICFLDADDTMMPTRVEKQYNAIKAGERRYPSRMVASFCGSIVNDITKGTKYNINPYNLFRKDFGGGTGHSMYKVADLKYLGNFDMNFSRSADAMMCISFLLNNGFFAMVNEPLITYNFVWDNSKKNVAKHEEEYFKELRQEIIMDNPQNIYLRRFCNLDGCKDSFDKTQVDLFGIKGIRLFTVKHKSGGLKHIVYLFGLIPLFRIKRIRD